MIRDALSGRTALITGTTGFVAKAVLSKALRDLPDLSFVCLVRRGRGTRAADRFLSDVLRAEAFDPLRRAFDGTAAEWEAWALARAQVVEGDLEADGCGLDDEGRAIVAGIDLVIHSAASVSFELALDEALAINVGGSTRLLRTVRELAGAVPFVHVSTAYVAGLRAGDIAERPSGHIGGEVPFDVHAEREVATAWRPQAEGRSRDPEMADRFAAEAREETGQAGTPAVARRAEELRATWVTRELADRGRRRS